MVILLATQQSKKLCRHIDECDKILVQLMKDKHERSLQRSLQKEDLDTTFYLEVAGRLKRLSSKDNAFAKMKIQQMLFDIEFAVTF